MTGRDLYLDNRKLYCTTTSDLTLKMLSAGVEIVAPPILILLSGHREADKTSPNRKQCITGHCVSFLVVFCCFLVRGEK